VVLTRAGSSIHCGRLEFYEDTSQIWLHREEHPNVRMELDDGSWATAAAIYIDRRAGIIKLVGPVRLESVRKGDPAATQPARRSDLQRMSIACSQMAELHLYDATESDGEAGEDFGGELSTLSRALKSAVFFGDVEVGMENRKLTSHRLDMSFRKLAREQSFEALIETAVATGNVVFTGETDRVTAGRLQIDFALAAGGEPYVSGLDSLGHVYMTRGNSWLKGERVVAVLDRPVVIADPAAAARSGAAGEPARRHAEFAIRTLDVYGDAELFRPDDNVGARGEHVAVWLAGENQFQRARIVGSPEEPALVHAEPYTVRGARIDIDGEALTLHVDGWSHLDFLTRRGLQGARGKPARVDVISQRLLHVDGRGNEIRIAGDVNVTRGNELLRADTLTLLLEDVATPDQPDQPDVRRARLGRLWSGIVSMVRGGSGGDSRTSGAGSRDRGRLEIAGFESERIGRKEPVRLIAENALVQTEIVDPAAQSAGSAGTGENADGLGPIMHRSLTAPRLVVDIPNGITTTFGQTALLVEDYRVDPTAARGANGAVDTQFVPSELVSGGPMQTAIFCEDRMTYALGDASTGSRDSVLLEGGVFLNHLTGREIIHFEQNPRLTRLDPDTIKKLRDRDSTLKCDRLECEFGDDGVAARPAAGVPGATSPGNVRSAATLAAAQAGQRPARPGGGDSAAADPTSGRLMWMLASGHVVLTDKQNGVTTEVYAERISFDRAAALVSVYGSPSVDARVYRFTADDKFSTHVGQEFHIDLVRNTVRAGGMGEVRP
jgi:lipopolysaccharide export system protein LptA